MSNSDDQIREILESTGDIEKKISERIDETTSLLEKRIDSLEELVANLTMAYTEVFSATESIIEELMSPRDEAEKEKFRQQINKRHAETLGIMQEVVNGMGNDTQASPGNPLLDVAAQKHTDRPER